MKCLFLLYRISNLRMGILFSRPCHYGVGDFFPHHFASAFTINPYEYVKFIHVCNFEKIHKKHTCTVVRGGPRSSHRFGIPDHGSASLEPVGARSGDLWLVPIGQSSPRLNKVGELLIRSHHGHDHWLQLWGFHGLEGEGLEGQWSSSQGLVGVG